MDRLVSEGFRRAHRRCGWEPRGLWLRAALSPVLMHALAAAAVIGISVSMVAGCAGGLREGHERRQEAGDPRDGVAAVSLWDSIGPFEVDIWMRSDGGAPRRLVVASEELLGPNGRMRVLRARGDARLIVRDQRRRGRDAQGAFVERTVRVDGLVSGASLVVRAEVPGEERSSEGDFEGQAKVAGAGVEVFVHGERVRAERDGREVEIELGRDEATRLLYRLRQPVVDGGQSAKPLESRE